MHTPAAKSQQRGGANNNNNNNRGRNSAGPSPSPLSYAAASPSPAAPSLAFSASKHVVSMRAQKAAGTKQAHSKTLFKPAMASPFNMPWNPLSLEQSLQVLTLLQQGLRELPLHSTAASAALASSSPNVAVAAAPSPSTPSSLKRKQPASSSSTAALKQEAKESETDSNASSAAAAGGGGGGGGLSAHGVCMGINSVTRLAEIGGAGVVVVCRSVAPLALVSHIPVLCHLRQLPLITLHPQINSRMLAQALQVHSSSAKATSSDEAPASDSKKKHKNKKQGAQLCMAMAIQRGFLASTVAALTPLATVPHLPWLTPAPVAYLPVNVLHTGDKPAPKQKAKHAPPAAQPKGAAAATAAGGAATGAATTPAAGATQPSHVVAAAIAAGGRIESATQRRKKQKVEQQQQRVQTPSATAMQL